MDINEFYQQTRQKAVNNIISSPNGDVVPLFHFLYDLHDDGNRDTLKAKIIELMTDKLFEINERDRSVGKTTFSRDEILVGVTAHFSDEKECSKKLRSACRKHYRNRYCHDDKKTRRRKTAKAVRYVLFNNPDNFWPIYPIAVKMCVPEPARKEHITAPADCVKKYAESVQAYNQDFKKIPQWKNDKAVQLGTDNLDKTYPAKMRLKTVRRYIVDAILDYRTSYHGMEGPHLNAQNAHVPEAVIEQVGEIIRKNKKRGWKK